MDDDLNTAEALAAVYEYVRAANTAIDSGQFLEGNRADAERVLQLFDEIFDVLTPSPAAARLGLADDGNRSAVRTAECRQEGAQFQTLG